MTSVESLYEQAMALPPEERTNLTARLVDSLPAEKAPGYDELWHAELDRRWAEHLADPGSAMPLDEFMTRLRAAARTK